MGDPLPHDDRLDRREADRRLEAIQQDLGLARTRWHKTTDMVQSQQGQLAHHEWRIKELEEAMRHIENTMDSLVTAKQLDNLNTMLDLRLQHLTTALAPIQRGFYWAIGIIIGAFLLALFTLVTRGAVPGAN